MPVTAGPVPGVTSGLRMVNMDPKRFRSGRWFLLAEGLLVSVFGIAGLVSATLHPHAGPTGARVLGLASTPVHSALLLAFGVVAVAALGNRRAAVTVTALSAVAYTMLLFFSSVATARTTPTLLGFHAADIVLHGVLAVVNLALLMWLIPDELGDQAWVPRRRGRRRDRRQPSASERVTKPAAASLSMVSTTNPGVPAAAEPREQASGAHGSPAELPVARAAKPAGVNQRASPRPSRAAEKPRNNRGLGPQRRALDTGQAPRRSGDRRGAITRRCLGRVRGGPGSCRRHRHLATPPLNPSYAPRRRAGMPVPIAVTALMPYRPMRKTQCGPTSRSRNRRK